MKVKTTFILLLVQFLYGEGNQYFQQMVKYEIDVTLNDSAHTLSAYMKLEYTNNSPDTLEFIWFHLWPNAYKNDSTAFAKQQFLEALKLVGLTGAILVPFGKFSIPLLVKLADMVGFDLDYHNYFYHGGSLLDVSIPEEKVRQFIKKHESSLNLVADEFIKKIHESNKNNKKKIPYRNRSTLRYKKKFYW